MFISLDYIKILEPLWGKWYLGNLLGEGSVGAVFQVHTHENETAALKYIHISFPETIVSSTIDKKNYIQNAIEKIKQSFTFVNSLKDCPNIVRHDELSVHKSDQSADVLIRMELLETLRNHIRQHGITERDVVKLGMDITSALVACHSSGLIHRDIKVENIFYHPNGYKLGDFDTAAYVNNKPDARCGTLSTIAPEVFCGQSYDHRSDIYSLGITIYTLLNGGSLPFLSEGENIKYAASSEAIRRRMSGEPLPPPSQASKGIAKLILKACSYKPEQRPQSAKEFHKELSKLLGRTSEKYVIQPKAKENIDGICLNDRTLYQTVFDHGFLFQTGGNFKTNLTILLPNPKTSYNINNQKSNFDQDKIPYVERTNQNNDDNSGFSTSDNHDDRSAQPLPNSNEYNYLNDDQNYGNNNGFPPSDNSDDGSTEPWYKSNKYNFLSWFLFTCTISLIPLILYLLCGHFIKKGNVTHSIYIHEVVFFSIVILSTALKDLYFGESRKEHPIVALIIGGSAMIILIIVSGLFAIVIVSELAPDALELNNKLLFPASIGICIPSVIMGAVVELMEDAL